jgi:ATP phosphoribosyltransferase
MKTSASLRVVLPKEGRLKRDVAALLSAARLATSQHHPRHDFGVLFDAGSEIPPVEFVTQRPFDALDSVAGAAANIAIVGLDMLYEYEGLAATRGDTNCLTVAATFQGVSACALYIAGPSNCPVQTPRELSGLRLATAYPESTRRWLLANNVSTASVIVRQGSIEDTVRLRIADLICDLVNSGESLRLNGLVPYFKVYDSTAVAVMHSQTTPSLITTMILNRLLDACSASARRDARPADKAPTNDRQGVA